MGRKNTVRRVLALIFALALLAVVPAVATAGTSGATVEGPGVYMDNVWITSSTGQAVYLNEGDDTAVTYGAPNGTETIKNGCIGGDGFGDLARVHDYTLEFKETVSDFSLRMLDFGDYNPDRSKSHKVVMTAYDADGGFVDDAVLEYASDGLVNPRVSDHGDLYLTGDACDAAADSTEPGNWVFKVSGSGIAKVTLQVLEGRDPNIAFSDMDFTIEDGSCVYDEAWESKTVTLWAGQNIDAGTVNVSYDGEFLYVEYQTSGMWLLEETHVSVVTDPGDFPTTRKGNPIPGRFEYSMMHDPWTDHYTEVIPWSDGFPVYVAAHAALVEANMAGPFWATEVVSFDQGVGKDGRLIADERSDPNDVLGMPDSQQPKINFFSLGFKLYDGVVAAPGGSIEVAFDGMILNGGGDYDVSIHETTWGRDNYPLEQVRVDAMYGGDAYPVGFATNQVDGITYLSLPQAIPYAEALVITDITDPALFGGNGDGFDLDAVDASILYYGEETGWGEGTRFVERGNWGMYFDYNPDSWCVWPDA